jgi:tetratricopeptide (TPR) repeat protein
MVAHGRELITQGDLPRATDLLNQAVKIYWAAGEQYSAAAQIGNYGWTLRRIGRADLAVPYLDQAAQLFDQMGLADFAERHRAAAADVASGLTPEFLAGLPPAVRGAIERGDGAALQFAIDQLPLADQELVIERLTAVGVISAAGGAADSDVEGVLRQFAPLLQGIADVARGDLSDRHDIDAALEDLERKGWRIRRAVHKIWQGQRKVGPLTNGLDAVDAALVRRILELI